MKKWIISIASVLAICLLLGGLCYVELGSWNVFRTGMALSGLLSGGDGVYQIADLPEKVWLSGSQEAFRDYLEGEGYVLRTDAQMGARIPVEKDGVRDYVYWSVNYLYHKWTWETSGEPAQALQTVPTEPVVTFCPETVSWSAYFYPEEAADITVRLERAEDLNWAYPAYGEGWRFTAHPDGTLTEGGRTFYSLYREENGKTGWPMEEGFCVAGDETAAFLEDAAGQLGLTPRETQDLILRFGPQMADNRWNLICFHVVGMEPDITPAPDAAIRIVMIWKSLEEPVEIDPQVLTAPRRPGFTAVELGGGRIE